MVEVYSNADEVELFVNGNPVGKKRTERYQARFETVFEPGEVTAVNLRNGRREETDLLKSASYDVHLEQHDMGDGVIELSVADENGVRNPDVTLSLTASVSGGRTILGFGTADPKNEENYYDPTTKTFCGRALIVTRGEGDLKIEVQ